MHKKLIIYGAGKRGRRMINILDFCQVKIAAVIDSSVNKIGTVVNRYKVNAPNILSKTEDYVLCITVLDSDVQKEIRDKLCNHCGWSNWEEISYVDLMLLAYEKYLRECMNLPAVQENRKKRTVIFDCEFGLVLGGIEEWSKGICSKMLAEGDFDAHILTNYGDYEIPDNLKNHIIRVDVKEEEIYEPSNMMELIKGIVPYLPCTIVTSHPNEVLLAGKLLKNYYGDSVQVIAGIRGGNDTIYYEYMKMEHCTDLFVCVSSDITRNMVSRGVDEDKVLTMICPMECPENLERTYTTDCKKPIRLGYAGRMVVEQKRMDLMLLLLDELNRRQVHYELEFAGAGDYEPQIRAYIEENKLSDKVKLVGVLKREELYQFWQNKDICLNIADYEGRSRAIAEAMANGAIPVVTHTSGVSDDIRHGENGLTVPVGDYIAMADVIEALAADRDRLPLMGRAAHLEIKGKSSMDEHYRFWKNILM